MKSSMAGWIAFAGMVLMIVGGVDVLQGLVAVVRDHYYTADAAFLVNVSAWGWIMMIWGALLFFAGYGLLSGATWARWFSIFLVAVNILGQLSFSGQGVYLWGLVAITLNIIVLYALIARWKESTAELMQQQ